MDYQNLFEQIHKRPSMYGLDGSFEQYCAFILGVDAGNDWCLLTGFREWLVTRLKGGDSVGWPGLVLHLLEGSDHTTEPHAAPPYENQEAVDKLFEALKQFFAERHKTGSLVPIYDNYLTWVKAQFWHRPETR